MTAWLYNHGNAVLAIDLDPQCNLSMIEGVNEEQPNILEVMQGKASAEKAIKRTETGYMVPGSKHMVNYNPTTANAVRNVLRTVEKKLSYCVIDTSPALDAMTINALVASDFVLVPCKADRFSLEALQAFFQTHTVARTVKPELKIGVFFTMYNPRATANKLLADQIREYATDNGITVFNTYIRRTVTIEEAEYLPNIFEYAPKSNAATDYNSLFTEVMEQLERRIKHDNRCKCNSNESGSN